MYKLGEHLDQALWAICNWLVYELIKPRSLNLAESMMLAIISITAVESLPSKLES